MSRKKGTTLRKRDREINLKLNRMLKQQAARERKAARDKTGEGHVTRKAPAEMQDGVSAFGGGQ